VIAALLVGCERADGDALPGDDDDDTTLPAVPLARLRVAHLGLGLGPVDLWIDGTVRPTFTGAAPPGGSRYRGADPGTRTFSAVLPGALPEEALATATATLEDGSASVMVLWDDGGVASLVVLGEDLDGLDAALVRYTLFPTLGVEGQFAGAPLVADAGERVALGDHAPNEASLEVDGCTWLLPAFAQGTGAALYLANDALYAHTDEAFVAVPAEAPCGP
jgi:hypothetical protein